MVEYEPSRRLVLSSLGDHRPRSVREIVGATGMGLDQAYAALRRCWEGGYVLRTRDALVERDRSFRGRGGVSKTTRSYHLYVLRPEGRDSLVVDGRLFVGFSKEHLDPRGGGGFSKSQRVLDFLRENKDRAFFSRDVVDALAAKGVKGNDIMGSVRRYERQGLIYVRGYKTDERQTPFSRGYLLTWLDQDRPRETAIEEAVAKTDMALDGQLSGNPVLERVHRIRDIIIEHTKLRKLVSHTYIDNKLGCSRHELESAVKRCVELYPDLKELKIFNVYKYYYHASLPPEDLSAALEMKKNYIRQWKGTDNRVGHNWEAVAEWFIDRFTTGAKFRTQQHRTKGMDGRRITIHLLKGVGGRRNAAEVDRVWEVTPGIFAPPITYILSCKWGLVNKDHVDDFLNVLRWSKDFGVDTPDGREVKQGIVGVFAASAFNPKEQVQLKDESMISLTQYAARRQLQLVTAADFNEKLREKGVEKSVTAQKICRVSRDEEEVRRALDAVWKQPEKADYTLAELHKTNEDLYKFEEMLESGSESISPIKAE